MSNLGIHLSDLSDLKSAIIGPRNPNASLFFCNSCKTQYMMFSIKKDEFHFCTFCNEKCEEIFMNENKIDHPEYYGGKDNLYEAIKVIEAWGLGFNLGSLVKYISRAGKKDPLTLVEDLKKARWYLDREIEKLG